MKNLTRQRVGRARRVNDRNRRFLNSIKRSQDNTLKWMGKTKFWMWFLMVLCVVSISSHVVILTKYWQDVGMVRLEVRAFNMKLFKEDTATRERNRWFIENSGRMAQMSRMINEQSLQPTNNFANHSGKDVYCPACNRIID